jgi:hypothetical protein
MSDAPNFTVLSADERQRFVAYCRQNVASNKAIMEQMTKLPGMDMVVRKLQAETVAFEVVANILEIIEEG